MNAQCSSWLAEANGKRNATTGRISRKKKNFEGLLKAVRDQNVKNHTIDVEKVDLYEYE